jgi:hypothetical protein
MEQVSSQVIGHLEFSLLAGWGPQGAMQTWIAMGARYLVGS